MADKDIEETAEELFEEPNGNLPEAPTSITIKGYYKGFSVLVTRRPPTNDVELEKIMKAIDNMVEKGFKPSWADNREPKTDKESYPQAVKKGIEETYPPCPLHEQPMDKVTVKGTPYHTFKGNNCSGEGWWPKKT